MNFEARTKGKHLIDSARRLVIEHRELREVDFSDRRLDQFVSVGSRFNSCDFSRANINDAALGAGRVQSEYVDCIFDGARMRAGGGMARFNRCSFRDVQLRDWFCFTTEFVECVFSGSLSKVVFHGAVPLSERDFAGRLTNEFRGNDFSNAHFQDVAFRTGIDLTAQILPRDDRYLLVPDAAAVLRYVKSAIEAWESKQRGQAEALLRALSFEASQGQSQLLLNLEASGAGSVNSQVRLLVQQAVEKLAVTGR
jgi:hypothetical protein